uniref:Transmembrane protein 231 n=1 Tax=Chromera velia CCMP2878 TaxID=1169474 RepID=A0A0G4G437_9ALVE|eukprot:Cvel_4153.t1-p1 / transcript=Cvel_4153.t1 / gene=Cvel_4153 / organism=Chromera_velia_CCMP2878 / gene_product=Transmembrane protein 231, putative / transcript_product=Transmembrane protein 231, putative / location=Cvel_scaffold178:41851-45253(-) / protein_length=330 / sequence_SO=supercontig / SO=protein_coding / is_pseudo=false
MKAVVVHNVKVPVTYVAQRLSCAYLFSLIVTLAAIIGPLYLAVNTRTFWPEYSYYYEQPWVRTTGEMIVITDSSSTTGRKAWSTYDSLNNQLSQYLGATSVQVWTEDDNVDGKADRLRVNVEVFLSTSPVVPASEEAQALQALDQTPVVQRAFILIPLSYRLENRVRLEMMSALSISVESPVAASKASIATELHLAQSNPLLVTRVVRDVYNTSSLAAAVDRGAVSLHELLQVDSQRNESLVAKPLTAPVWTHSASSSFVFEATVNIGRQQVQYVPVVGDMLRAGWIQYLALLVPFLFIAQWLKDLVFQQHLLPARVIRPALGRGKDPPR